MRALAVLAVCAVLAGCGASAATDGAQAAADATTKAIYNDDYDAVTTAFDTSVKAKITRGDVGLLSDKLRALGDYKGLTLVGGDAAKNEFEYRAGFNRGSVNVVVRLDPSGRLSAYHLL